MKSGLLAIGSLLEFALLFVPISVDAQGAGTQVTAGQVNQAVGEIQKRAENEIQQGAVPGLAFQDQVVCATGFGVQDVNAKEPVNADTVFQLASLSKPIGSTVIALSLAHYIRALHSL